MAMLRALASAMTVATFFEIALCVNYNVAWDLSTNYTHWVSGKTFRIGDTLTFKYPPTTHDVVEVDSTGYSACNAGTSTASATGNTEIRLTATGKRYFICGIPTHCSQGMQLEIDVVHAMGETSPPSSSPPSPVSDSTSPAQAPASSTPPPSPLNVPSPPNAAVPGSITGEAKVTLGLGLATVMVALGL
ncbi:cucumber peeling cupredoxin-like [Zingiber officinale]|uniref:Phytocyanin domain-containing protein n=1 Tax=Zingiber officinale TaxID=94328 RepID=A0A8J5LUP8_ZINOF|nr:cucumber peeling cupredoxin-like [Zingiber officinale]KAG6535878.1 hypothetical protein ZIOFF_000908 [Zingiber officinale]